MTPTAFSSAIRWPVEELDDGNRSAFSRRVGVSVDTPSSWIWSETIRPDSLLQLCARLGFQPDNLLLRDRDIRFAALAVEDFPRQRRRSTIDWLRVERQLDAMLEGTEAVSLRDAARIFGVRVNSLQKRLPAKVENLRQRAR